MFIDMISELRGQVPNLPYDLCTKLINNAWRDVRRKNLWSFQLYEKNWLSPEAINQTGTADVTRGSASVTVDATAAAAIDASIASEGSFSPITTRQFRVAAGTVYNITEWDTVTDTLTLDRIYGESTTAGATFSIYQVYYPAPFEDHLTFMSVRDMTNFVDLFLNQPRSIIDARDPQRTWYYFPTHVFGYMTDQNPESDTYRFMLYELWGAPQYALTWQLYGIRKLTDLVDDDDVLPPAIGEDCVVARAKYYAYEWAEANKGALPRNQGPDFKMLMGMALADYNKLYKEYRTQDRETVNNWFSIRRLSIYGQVYAYYNSIAGNAYPGIGWV